MLSSFLVLGLNTIESALSPDRASNNEVVARGVYIYGLVVKLCLAVIAQEPVTSHAKSFFDAKVRVNCKDLALKKTGDDVQKSKQFFVHSH